YLDVTVRHPFPNIIQRRDLNVFDPRLVVVTGLRSEWGPVAFPQMGTYDRPASGGGSTPTVLEANTSMLLNADGYTTHFDERVDHLAGKTYTGTLNPYINYATTLFPDDFSSGFNPYHLFAQSRGPETRTIKISLPSTVAKFDAFLMLEVNYGQSATKFTRLNPQYYNPEFNRKEAYNVEVQVGTASDGLRFGSALPLTVNVKDWQQTFTLDPTYPNPGNTTGLRYISTVADVSVAIPGWTAGTANQNIALSGAGTESSPLQYGLSLTRDAFYPPRTGVAIPILVRVRDSQDGSSLGNTNPAFDLGQTYDACAYTILDYIPVRGSTVVTEPPNPGALIQDLGQQIRLAPYPNAGEGSSTTEPIYESGATTAFSASPYDMRLIVAGNSGDLAIVDPVDVSLPSLWAAGLKPYDDFPNTGQAHPAPESLMPITGIAADPNGNTIVSFFDDNFTIDAFRFSTGITDPVANSAVIASWINEGASAGRVLNARLSDGCGSAPGPDLGSKVRGVVAVPQIKFLDRWTHILGFISAGVNCEACGNYASLTYYGQPYSSESDRAFTVDLTNVAVALLGIPSDVSYRRLTSVVPLNYNQTTRTWPHVAFKGDTAIVFDALENYNPNLRTSAPSPIVTRSFPITDQIIDAVYVPFDPASPFALGSTVQTTDWVIFLTRGLTGYDLTAVPTSGFAGSPDAFEDGTVAFWGTLGQVATDLDYDPINQMLILSYDSNGIAAGGNIQSTILMPQ
ncbi:MAG: hypothetical protein ABI743_04155, partial [bacterium]